MEYDTIQPFGDIRSNWHAALIAQILCAVNTSKNHRPPKVSDFLFKDEQTRHDEQEQELLSWLRAMKVKKAPVDGN
jgi:hypothetical protein